MKAALNHLSLETAWHPQSSQQEDRRGGDTPSFWGVWPGNVTCHFHLCLVGQNVVTWLHLAAGEPGKYSLYPGIACLIMYLLLFSRQVTSNSSRPHGLYHARLLCPPSSPRVCPSSCPINQWCLLIYQDYVPYDNCEAKTICDFWTRFFPWTSICECIALILQPGEQMHTKYEASYLGIWISWSKETCIQNGMHERIIQIIQDKKKFRFLETTYSHYLTGGFGEEFYSNSSKVCLLIRSGCGVAYSCLVAELCPILFNPMGCGPPGSFSMGFSRQEYWSGLPFPSPGNLPDSGIKPRSPALQADSLPSEPLGKPFGSVKASKIFSCAYLEAEPGPCPTATLLFLGCSSRVSASATFPA